MSASAVSVLPAALGTLPMPRGTGLKIRIPRFGTVASGTVAKETEVVSKTAPSTLYAEAPPALVSAQLTVSNQLAELAGPLDFDTYISAELGAAIGTALDLELLTGTATNGHTRGILETTGALETKYTTASPTTQTCVRVGLAANWSGVSMALGKVADTVLLSPRRLAWLFSGYAESKQIVDADTLEKYGTTVVTPAMPITAGVSKEEDPIITLNKSCVQIFLDPVRIKANPQTKAGNLEIVYTATVWCGLVVRQPAGVGWTLGTGLKGAVFT